MSYIITKCIPDHTFLSYPQQCEYCTVDNNNHYTHLAQIIEWPRNGDTNPKKKDEQKLEGFEMLLWDAIRERNGKKIPSVQAVGDVRTIRQLMKPI